MRFDVTFNNEFNYEYNSVIRKYIAEKDEYSLHQAYELGRRALDSGQLILQCFEVHNEILSKVILDLSDKNKLSEIITAATAFFSEFLSPFEMTYRGFLQTVQNLKIEIAEKLRAEEALRQSEKYYKSLIENALDTITILDSKGNIKFKSQSTERVLGYLQDELLGKNIFSLIHPDDVDTVVEIFKKGIGVHEFTSTAEFRFKHKNGQWLILESIGKNMLDDPLIDGVIVNSRDITDRRNLEDIRRKYEFIVNASKEMMGLVNKEYRYEAVNEAYCNGLSKHRVEIVGKHVSEIFGIAMFTDLMKNHIDECFSGSAVHYEDWFAFPNKGKRFLEVVYYPYKNERSIITHVVIINRDITERKKTEDKIRESQEELNRIARQRAEDLQKFAQSIQKAQEEERRRIARELHDDICQRLTALKLQMNVFEDTIHSNKTYLKKIGLFKNEVDDLIVEVRRISTNLRPSALDHFGLVTTLRLLGNDFEKLHSVKVDFETKIPSLKHFNPDIEIAVYRIAQEALTNYVKHAKTEKVYFKISESENNLILNIIDHGVGFDTKNYFHGADISNRFFGLINMRERTELIGGNFQIESAPGTGTKVQVIVPLIKNKANEKN